MAVVKKKTGGQAKPRPKRKKLDDILLHQAVRAEQLRCDMAVGPFDKMAREMDYKWGVDRLPDLVSPETAEKYGSALAKLNAAIEEEKPDVVAARAAVCMRGLAVMDAEAVQAGHTPASDNVLLVEVDGHEFGILLDDRGWQRAQDKHPGMKLLTRREVAMAIRVYRKTKLGEMVDAAKLAFPNADVDGVRIDGESVDDPIPF